MSEEKIVEAIAVVEETTATVVEETVEATPVTEETTTTVVEETITLAIEATPVTEENAEATPVTEENEETSKPTKEEFEALLSEGKRAFMLESLSEAAEKLSQAASISVELFGEFSPETFEPHFQYGKALLESISSEKELLELKEKEFENDPIIGEIKKNFKTLVQNVLENQEKEDAAAETNDNEAQQETEEKEATLDESNVEMGDADETVEADQQKEIDVDQTANNEEEFDEDVENSQLAFESLDYARIVCEKNLGSDNDLTWLERQKDTLILLGQVALNDDNYETALQDLSNALKIVNEKFSTDLREIAFINMELNRVFRKTNDLSSATDCVENAIKALEQYKAKLQAEPQVDEEKLNEINELLEEVVGEKNLLQTNETDKENVTATTNNASAEDFKTVDTLIIKRKEKRAANDEPEDEEVTKKAKTEA